MVLHPFRSHDDVCTSRVKTLPSPRLQIFQSPPPKFDLDFFFLDAGNGPGPSPKFPLLSPRRAKFRRWIGGRFRSEFEAFPWKEHLSFGKILAAPNPPFQWFGDLRPFRFPPLFLAETPPFPRCATSLSSRIALFHFPSGDGVPSKGVFKVLI